MIDGVGQGGAGRIDPARQEKGTAVGAPRAQAQRAGEGGVKSAVLELVASGPPVDTSRVEETRAAIRDGRYPVDPARIAVRMLQLDLPRRG